MSSYTESRQAQYHFRVSKIVSTDPQQQQHRQPLKPTDSFIFEVVGGVRIRSSDPNSHHYVYNSSPLFQTSISITCERFFFGDNPDFLRTHITNQPYFPPQNLDYITQYIIPEVQQLFPFGIGFSKPSDPEPQEFRLALHIMVDVVDDDEFELAVMEESMQQQDIVRMIPASKEAIQSLKTYKLPDQCHICMEKFHGEGDDDDDDVLFTPMPCGHGFHHKCILQWLQTSHMCPICRYPLSTANN